MADSRKVLMKEITQLKKRIASSRNSLREAYKDFSKEAKKAYKGVVK